MTLGFFTLSALDLLGALHTHTTSLERESYVNWIYRCQHADGGFRGFTGADTGETSHNQWDPANVASTYFALAALLVLGDGLERVKRRRCLGWLKGLQIEDGSFGEVRGGQRGGDMRFCCCAASVRWMLGGGRKEETDLDFDVEGLVRFIQASQVSFGEGRENELRIRDLVS